MENEIKKEDRQDWVSFLEDVVLMGFVSFGSLAVYLGLQAIFFE